MRIFLRAKRFLTYQLAGIIAVVLLCAAGPAWSQTGVAPSQTGSFFDDLRKRSETFREGAVDESATERAGGIYDYERGEYIGESFDRPLGERSIGGEASRAIGTNTSRSGYAGYAKRSPGDYTGTAGSPYPSTNSFFAPTYITDPFLAGKRNIKIGPINIGLGMNSSVEYNDNITQAHEDRVDDLIIGLYLNVDANWQLTERNRLSLTTTVGVDHYLNHPDLSPRGKEYNFVVYPGSTLSFDFDIGGIHFVLYDRITIRQASQSEFALDDLDVFGVFQNDIGLAMNWPLNSKLILSMNFNRSDSVALEADYSTTDRTIDSFSGSLGWTPSGTYTIGVEGSLSWINYVEEFNNDGTTASGGIFVASPITRNTLVKASVGVQNFKFDTPPVFTRTVTAADVASVQLELETLATTLPAQQAAIQNNALLTPQQKTQQIAALTARQTELQEQLATLSTQLIAEDLTEASRSFDRTSEYTDYYYNVTLFNQLNSRISHQLSFGHETALNTASNFVSSDYASYGVGIIAWRGARISISGFWEDAQDSGGRLAETVQQYGCDVLLTHRLTGHLTLTLGYHFGDSDSEEVGRDYEQETYSIDFNYSVNSKLNLGLGLRMLTTTAENELQSFDQNRITLSMNYNF